MKIETTQLYKSRILCSIFVLTSIFINAYAQNKCNNSPTANVCFNEFFCDSTLRLDYIFSGNKEKQQIAIDKYNVMPRWYGKHNNLDILPVEGNGQIIVRCHNTQQVIYTNSFSTLFQEWLTYDEAEKCTKAFENVFLIPMPRDTVDVTINLRNNRREITTSLVHTIAPEDILIRKIGFSKVTPYQTLQQAADTSKCINIAFLAEGYKTEEMPTFINDATIAMNALFEHEPFKKYQSKFNIVAVKSASEDSGTSEPSVGLWKNTAVGSHFSTFYSERYLTTLNIKKLHDLLAGVPYEHIIILVNTEKYGGGGILNSYNLSMTHHPFFKQVVVHEFGHSFAGLADEYAYEQEPIPMYPSDIEPWEKNITTLVDFNGKWEKMIDKHTPIPTPLNYVKNATSLKNNKAKKEIKVSNNNIIGAYEGAGYSLKGVYRPCTNCRMRTNEHPYFCPACQKAISELIEFYTE